MKNREVIYYKDKFISIDELRYIYIGDNHE